MSHHFIGFAHFGHGPVAVAVLILIAIIAAALIGKESSKAP